MFASLATGPALEPKTSFPGVDLVEEPLFCCELFEDDGTFPPGAGLEAGATEYFKGFPSKRLPTPVNALNFGSAATGSSCSARENRITDMSGKHGYFVERAQSQLPGVLYNMNQSNYKYDVNQLSNVTVMVNQRNYKHKLDGQCLLALIH